MPNWANSAQKSPPPHPGPLEPPKLPRGPPTAPTDKELVWGGGGWLKRIWECWWGIGRERLGACMFIQDEFADCWPRKARECSWLKWDEGWTIRKASYLGVERRAGIPVEREDLSDPVPLTPEGNPKAEPLNEIESKLTHKISKGFLKRHSWQQW